MIRFLIFVIAVLAFDLAIAQKFQLKDSNISFYSSAPLEDIEAKNSGAKGVIDIKNNNFYFKVPIRSFKFKSSLMEDHFNENYLESEKYPASTFKGKIEGNYDLTKEGNYPVNAVGDLNLHGVVKPVIIPSTISVQNGVASIQSKFKIRLADYKIEIPTIVFNKISEEVEVKINSNLELMNK